MALGHTDGALTSGVAHLRPPKVADRSPVFHIPIPQPRLDLEFDKRWRDLLKAQTERFGQPVDLNGLLFLIGVQELGQDVRTYKKDEKVNLMHIAICVLLVPYGYYKELGRDPDGWPHFERVKDLPSLEAKEQERLMKEAILAYFSE